MKNKILILALMAISIFTVSSVSAKDINNFYATADQNVILADKIIGDSAIAGSMVDIKENIEGIGLLAGQTINVNGNLDYAFIAGQTINITSEINKNVYIAGKTISFDKDSKVGRDTKIVGEDINLSGKYGRHMDLGANKIVFNDNTIINGNVTLNAEEIEIMGNVTIEGTLKYNEDASIKINDSASIKNIEKSKKIEKKKKSINVGDLVLSMINMIVVTLVISLLLPKTISKTDEIYENKGFEYYAKNFGIGLLFLICIPVATLILLVSNIGTSLGLILGALYIVALYLAYCFSGYIFGELIFNRLLKLNINKYLIIIMGIVLIKLLVLIPIIGSVVSLIALAIGITSIWELIKEEDTAEKAKEIKETKKVNNNKNNTKAKTTNKKNSSSTAKKQNTKNSK